MAIERIIHPIWSHWIGRRRLHCFLSLSLTHSHQHSSFSQTFFFNPLETNLRTYYYYLVSHTFTPMLYTQALLTKSYLRTYVLKFFISLSLSLSLSLSVCLAQHFPNSFYANSPKHLDAQLVCTVVLFTTTIRNGQTLKRTNALLPPQ